VNSNGYQIESTGVFKYSAPLEKANHSIAVY